MQKLKTKKIHFLKIKMLSTKILVLLIVSIVIAVTAATTTSYFTMNSMADKMALENATISVKVMQTEFESEKNSLKISADAIAKNAAIITDVSGKNGTALLQDATSLVNALGVQTCMITDEKGVVLARTHDPSKSGDDVSAQANVAAALKGNAVVEIETGTTVRYAI
jgi:methyl-accepting chemotaxis protein